MPLALHDYVRFRRRCDPSWSTSSEGTKATGTVRTQNSLQTQELRQDPIVVVGTGPVGIHCVRELLEHTNRDVIVYGGEPWAPYDRVRLSTLLSGETRIADVALPMDALRCERVKTHLNLKVEQINTHYRTIKDTAGQIQPYSDIVIATGSSPALPTSLRGSESLRGVHTFRDMNDVQALAARQNRSTHTIVVGGGPLGIEAAAAMRRHNTDVTLIEHNAHVMFRHLDRAAAHRIEARLAALGVRVLTRESLRMAVGTHELEGAVLRREGMVRCDTMVVATGITPNVDIAREAGVAVGKGIRVNQRMRTSSPHVYAVGDCCEYEGRVYGLIAPGLEQASVAARSIAGDDVLYEGTLFATSLKVIGLPVFSMGEVGQPGAHARVHVSGDSYRSISFERGRPVGVVAIGDWPDLPPLRERLSKKRRLLPWETLRFRNSGRIWPDSHDASTWSNERIVCNCNGISAGALRRAMEGGCTSVTDLSAATRAATTCGSCAPDLINLLGSDETPEPVRHVASVRVSSWVAALAGLTALAVSVPYAQSVQAEWLPLNELWTEGDNKRVSGFTLLGAALLLALVSLRKRLSRLRLFDFAHWRLAHVLMGGLSLAALFVHTGFRLGHNLNLYLMVAFLAAALSGAALGLAIAYAHRLPQPIGQRVRSAGVWTHLAVLAPLPVLLGAHITKSYYF